jgi:uncharacterized protein YdcH (DUF465 family)
LRASAMERPPRAIRATPVLPRCAPCLSAGAFSCAAGPGVAPGSSTRPIPRSGAQHRAHHHPCEEVSMFEGQPQSEVEALMKANAEFRQLYHRHKELDKQVLDAELGVLPVDDVRLNLMKREKLAAKDRLLRMYDALHH